MRSLLSPWVGNRKRWGVLGRIGAYDFGFEPRNPRYGPFVLLAVLDTNDAQLGHFSPFYSRFSDMSWS